MTEGISEAISALGNILVAGAAIAGAIAAFMGLNTWRKQAEWQIDRDLAKRVYLAALKHRRAIDSARHPVMYSGEMQVPAEQLEKMNVPDRYDAGVIYAYEKRWEKVIETAEELDAILLESDVAWGSSLRDILLPIFVLRTELKLYIRTFLHAHHHGNGPQTDVYHRMLAKRRDVLYADTGDEDDEFSREIATHFSNVEEFLRKKLGRASAR